MTQLKLHYCVRKKEKAIESLAFGLKLYTESEKSDYKIMVVSGYAFCLPKMNINGLSTEVIWFSTLTISQTSTSAGLE